MILKDNYNERHIKPSVKGAWKRFVGVVRLFYDYAKQMKLHSLLLPHRESCGKKYRISVCAIFKDEAPYLIEWLEHHLKTGIEHFYMYNNNSSDDYLEKLKPYLESGRVTLVDWPAEQKQLEAYEDCIRKYANESKWIGFIDLDEFVMLREDIASLNVIFDGFSKDYPAVFLNWKCYGSSGLRSRDLSRPVVKDFTQCREYFSLSGKVFFNTLYEFKRDVQKNTFFHCLYTEYNGELFAPVNVFEKPVARMAVQIVDNDFPAAWINHYRIKSLEEYKGNRMRKGDAFYEKNPHTEEYFAAHDRFHTSSNDREYAKRMDFIKRKYTPQPGPLFKGKRFVKRMLGLERKEFLTDEENDRSDTSYIFQERIAVYTCIIGGYDEIYEPVVSPENIDYYIVTDRDVPVTSKWKKIDAGRFPETRSLTPYEKNRYFKMHPHLLFPDYEYSIYVDGNIKIISDFSEHMNRLSAVGFSTFKHHRRETVYQEIEACLLQHKAPEKELLDYREKLLREGFPGDYGLAVCNILVRAHHRELCMKIMEDWWEEYLHFVHRDQVALPRILKNNHIQMKEITVLGINEYKDPSFIIAGHRSPAGNEK